MLAGAQTALQPGMSQDPQPATLLAGLLEPGELLPLPPSLCGIAFGLDRQEDLGQQGGSLYLGPIK